MHRTAWSRSGHQALSWTRPHSSRGLASATPGAFTYETGQAAGVKIASRNLPGPTTYLAVIAKAGTRYQPLPGYSEGLERFAFKNTHRRSALRITRETELLGGEFSTWHSRESLVIGVRFLRENLPYFTELLGEVISQTKFTTHELHEEVERVIELQRQSILGNPLEFALSSAHGVAYHRGLGNPLHPVSLMPTKKYLQADLLEQYSQAAYAKSNIAVVANGSSFEDLNKWVAQFFQDCPATPSPDFPFSGTSPTKYYGGEERISHPAGNAVVIAFPGSSSFTGASYKPEIAVLAALLGGQSSIKWNTGFSLLSKVTSDFPQTRINTNHNTYSDTGLLTISITGPAKQVHGASKAVTSALKDTAAGKISSEDIKKARATAKFQALESGQNIETGIELTGAGLISGGKAFQIEDLGKQIGQVTDEQVKKAAKSILDGKASVATVGDLYALPYAEELGLNI